MKVIHDLNEIYAQLEFVRRDAKRIGLVPTMGALHDGHLSLVQRANEDCDVSVATIFVNPTQFGPNEDLSKYPRTLDSDLEKLRASNCSFAFVPSSEKIYSPTHSTYIEPPAVAKRWEGEIRPGHFRGVATIVLKLFQLVPAHVAFFGRKDYQQLAVIRAMVDDLNMPIRIEACPTIRETDGLAMSSRNRYLSPENRQRACGLWRALSRAQELVVQGECKISVLNEAMRQELVSAPVDRIDYAELVHGDSLEPLQEWNDNCVAIIAARLGETRLIDNLSLVRPREGQDAQKTKAQGEMLR
jgi:pantoate--beta-alanine ligase